MTPVIAEAPALDWPTLVDALAGGHRLPEATLTDTFVDLPHGVLLSRAAAISGLGAGVKSVTVTPRNAERGLPTIDGGMLVFDEETGVLEAVIESALVTRLKTAADSVLGARLLARPDARTLLIIGAGTVAGSLIEAYPAVLPGVTRIMVWNRTRARAEALAAGTAAEVADDLASAIGCADIIATATMSKTPVLRGALVRPGTHVDLIGAFTADMREADDDLMRAGRIFVESRASTLAHIGELKIPIESGVITSGDVVGDLYQLVGGAAARETPEEITVFKNGGGAHLDLMTARAILASFTLP